MCEHVDDKVIVNNWKLLEVMPVHIIGSNQKVRRYVNSISMSYRGLLSKMFHCREFILLHRCCASSHFVFID
jgi:hypothetical protein